jgi:hypothetical protein
MALPLPLHVNDAESAHAPRPASRTLPASRQNVIPFPLPSPSRARLPVTLLGISADDAIAQLKLLLHSPLGVYVVSSEVVHDHVHLNLDIAPDDLDFTMHALLTTLPYAMIGPLKRHHVGNAAREAR